MQTNQNSDQNLGDGEPHEGGPKGYCVNIEGTEHTWESPTITFEQIAELGGWDPAKGVTEVDIHNNERNLEPGEVIHLQPGQGFCRRIRWKRGFRRADRIQEEIELLRREYPSLVHEGDWVRIPGYSLPTGWNRGETDVVIQILDSYPGAPPYGFHVSSGLRFGGKVPDSYKEPSQNKPPFDGEWGFFSWAVETESDWQVATSVKEGANMLHWVRSFAQRFAGGA